MNLLVIGGTRFLGRAIVDAALARGHEVTMFNRGQSNPGLYPEVEKIQGNRDGGLDVLAGRTWDAVVDTCGYVPRLVRDSARFLRDAVNHYTFISTISVYPELPQANMDETAPLGTIADETTEQITGESYGPLKVLCEKAVTEEMNGRSLHVRAGLIVGPHDLSDRFTYWPCRIARGGQVLAPSQPESPTQFVDVRDIAEWTVKATEARLTGPYNVTGPDYTLTLGQLFDKCREISGSDATFTWVNDEFLVAHEVGAYTELPLWIPGQEAIGFNTVNCQKAIGAGLTFRPLLETVRDTLAWANGRSADYQWRNGMKAERETALLQEWANVSKQ